MRSPNLLKVNQVLLLFILIPLTLYFGQKVLIPLTFAILLTMLLTPFADKLENKNIGRVWSTLICLLTFIISIGLIFLLVGSQISSLGKDMPQIKEKSAKLLSQTQQFIEQKFKISKDTQNNAFNSFSKSSKESASSFFKTLAVDLSSILAATVIVLIFLFLFLYQREKYNSFILKLYRGDQRNAKIVLTKISKVSQHYLVGRFLSIIIMFTLFAIGFFIFGIKNALLLALIASLLTIIPYVGTIIGGVLPVLFALVTEDVNSGLAVLGVIILVSSIDNYFVEPYVVGGEVNLSGFSTILILMIGGYLWGVAGMILFIPLLGITKIIFDNVEELKPYGYLIGDQKSGNPSTRIMEWIKSKFKKKKK